MFLNLKTVKFAFMELQTLLIV